MITWILVSDASRARLFSLAEKEKTWELVQAFEHPESRAKGSELITDKPGRMQQSAGRGNRPAMEPHMSPKEVEADVFVRELADYLDNGRTHNAYQNLALVAPPSFLGKLRNSLSVQVMKHVVVTVDKDYTQISDRDLHKRLDGVLENGQAKT